MNFFLLSITWLAIAVFNCNAFADSKTSNDYEVEEVIVREDLDKKNKIATFKSDIIATEAFSRQELKKNSGSSGIIDALGKYVGVSQELGCSISAARGISLNQMPSVYTTMLVDGIPIYSAVSTTYGLDFVDINNVESIEVSRGAGANVVAPAALAGSVNIITRRPTKNLLSAELTFGSYNTKELKGYASKVFKDRAFSINFVQKERGHIDSDRNGISESAQYKRNNIGLSYFFDDIDGFKIKGSLSVFDETRQGGANTDDISIIKSSNSGNPFNFENSVSSTGSGNSIAPYSGYDGGLNGISEIITSRRVQSTTTANKKTTLGNLRLAIGLANNNQDSSYSGDIYAAKHNQTFVEIAHRFDLQKINSSLTFGYNNMFENLRSRGYVYSDDYFVNGIDNYSYKTHALYMQFYNAAFNDKLETNIALRSDYHSKFNGITTPRVNFLLHHNKKLSSRFSVGTGYRVPTSYFEYEHGLLSVSQIHRNINSVEKSKNLSYAIAFEGDRLNFTSSYNYTKVSNMAKIEINDANDSVFANADHDIIVQNVNFNSSYLLTPKFNAGIGAEYNQFTFITGDFPIAKPNSRIFLTTDYKHSQDLNFFARLNINGKTDLQKFYGQRYNLDGTAKSSTAPMFATFDMQASYKINKQNLLTVGVDNLFNYVQAKHDSQLYMTQNGDFDVLNIWGPTIGRYLYIKWRVEL